MTSPQLIRDLARSSLGARWDALLEEAVTVIAYGSQATGEADLDSDLDLLAVKEHVPAHSKGKWNFTEEIRGVQIAWFPISKVSTPEFLGSEIARAVQQDGILLHGTWEWKEQASFDVARALPRKEHIVYRLIRSRIDAAHDDIPGLNRKIHRQLHRWLRMRNGDNTNYSGPALDALPLSKTEVIRALKDERLLNTYIRQGLDLFFADNSFLGVVPNVPFTFSLWCRSGFVGNYLDRCECGRCRRSRGEEVTAETEALAEKNAEEADEKYSAWMRDFLARRRTTP